MLFRYLIATILMAGLATSLSAQTANIVIDSDVRLFTTMAALNAAGFDVEIASQYHPVRADVRRFAEGLDPGLLNRLRNFYLTRKGSESDEAQLSKYISLALTLSGPPDFRFMYREELLPPDARSIAGFPDLLREFYEKAGISRRWAQAMPVYEEAIHRFAPRLRETILATDAYLRVPLGGNLLRSLTIYVELAAPVNTVNVRSYQDEYFVVLGGSTSLNTDDVRHAYLHFQLDGLMTRYTGGIENRGSLLALIQNVEGVDPTYASDFNIMATESFIRAVELRMESAVEEQARESLKGYYRSSMLLAPYFYDALIQYEQRDDGVRGYMGQLISEIQIRDEQQRFQENFHQIPLTPPVAFRDEVPEEPQPESDPAQDLLKEAEAAFNADQTEQAHAIFEKVLAEYDPGNGPALYGLALLASRDGDSELALDYFERTVQSESAEPSMKVWSYIFLGRILDLDCERERAVQYYQRAAEMGDDTRNAQAAAQEGLERPFGDGCR